MGHHGTSKAYILDRLRRTEGLAHLADAVESGAIPAHAVALELGWIRLGRWPVAAATQPSGDSISSTPSLARTATPAR